MAKAAVRTVNGKIEDVRHTLEFVRTGKATMPRVSLKCCIDVLLEAYDMLPPDPTPYLETHD